jgi:hypothetical protein
MLGGFRDWLFGRIRASGARAALRARQAEWFLAPPCGRDFVSELERVLRETGANPEHGSDASGDNSPDEHNGSAPARSTTSNERAGSRRPSVFERRSPRLTDCKTPRR